jgi:hypothetical protein
MAGEQGGSMIKLVKKLNHKDTKARRRYRKLKTGGLAE